MAFTQSSEPATAAGRVEVDALGVRPTTESASADSYDVVRHHPAMSYASSRCVRSVRCAAHGSAAIWFEVFDQPPQFVR
jgi:hypothetical protein